MMELAAIWDIDIWLGPMHTTQVTWSQDASQQFSTLKVDTGATDHQLTIYVDYWSEISRTTSHYIY